MSDRVYTSFVMRPGPDWRQPLARLRLPARLYVNGAAGPRRHLYGGADQGDRKGDHQLMTSAFVGEAQSSGKDDPEDLYHVDEVIPGDKTAPAVGDTGCAVQWPS